MIHGLSFPRTVSLPVLAALVAGLLAGCSGFTTSLQYESYPKDLRYPLRADVLVPPKEIQFTGPNVFPSPGQLDESIKKAAPAAPDPKALTPDDRKELAAALNTVFGTPAAPRVGPSEDSDEAAVYKQRLQVQMQTLEFTNTAAFESLEVDEAVLVRGSKLYRRHCMHCHGLAGDGRGPTGPWVQPHPRDYRAGLFKFMSTGKVEPRKPRRADLVRILHQGIDGTSMPAFGLLPDHELQYLASYVIHLSIRGQVEFDTMTALLAQGGRANLEKEEGKDTGDIHLHVYSRTAGLMINWAQSNSSDSLTVPPYKEPEGSDDEKKKQLHTSISNGYKLFIGKAACISCHTDFGRQVNYRHDYWGTTVRPFNLTTNTYRGGRRPVDLYYRIEGGIVPSGMPSIGDNIKEYKDEKKTALDPDGTARNYWDLITFVKALPYPNMLPDDVRQAVYGGTKKDEKHASAK